MVCFKDMTLPEIARYLDHKRALTPTEMHALSIDRRAGAALLLKKYKLKLELKQRELERLQNMLAEEKALWAEGYKAVAGVDEAGRGPLAGPVFAAAVVLKPGQVFAGLNDSKQLSATMREKLFEQIIQETAGYGIGSASKDEIDSLNIHAASMLAMQRSLEKLPLTPDFILVDGYSIKAVSCRQKAIKGGDNKSLSIAAASVLAKVSRDSIMKNLHLRYPHYGFDRNMGYGTDEHQKALLLYGPCPEHRCSFNLGGEGSQKRYDR